MAYAKKRKEIVKFEDDQPVSLVLDTDPSRVKGKTSDGEYGPRTSYMYFTGDERIFYATEYLHNQLETFRKGDEVTITKVRTDNGRVNWSVKRGGDSARSAVNSIKKEFNNSSLDDRVKKLENAIFGKGDTPSNQDEEEDDSEEEKNTEGLGF